MCESAEKLACILQYNNNNSYDNNNSKFYNCIYTLGRLFTVLFWYCSCLQHDTLSENTKALAPNLEGSLCPTYRQSWASDKKFYFYHLI